MFTYQYIGKHKKKKIVFFDKVLLNNENAYDSTSGIFTAPSDII